MSGEAPGGAVVVGAGLAGLCAAYTLSREGWRVTVLEKEARAGGRSRTVEAGGFQFDIGAQHFRDSCDETLKTAIDIGLGAEMRFPGVTKGVFHEGSVRTFLPRSKSPAKIVPWGALDPRAALGLFSTALPLLRHYRAFNVRFPEWWEEGGDRTAAQYLAGRAGGSAIRSLAEPASLYATGAGLEETSGAAFLAAMRIVFADRTGAFAGGMGALAAGLAERLEVNTGVEVERVLVESKRAVGVVARPAGGGSSRRYGAELVVCAVSAPEALIIAPEISGAARLMAAGTSYATEIVVNFGFGSAVEGVAATVLFPESQGFRACWACTNASKTAEYAPPGGSTATVVFSGERTMKLLGESDDKLCTIALEDLSRAFTVPGGVPREVMVERHLSGRPVMTPGHAKRIRDLRREGSGVSGLVLAGDWTSSPTVEGAVRSGVLAAAAVPGQGC